MQQSVTFQGTQGQLSGILHQPAGAARATAVFAHCFTCSKEMKAATHIARSLEDQGIATLRFDFTGLGESEGEFAASNFSSNVEDLVLASGFLREQVAAPKILVGHSLGGAAVLAAAHRVPECEAVATVGAPFDPAHVSHLIQSKDGQDGAKEWTATIAGREFRVQRQFVEDLEKQSPEACASGLGRALLVFHSPQDEIVGVENARQIYEAARHPKSFVSLDGADHLLRRAADAKYVGTVLAAWATRYVSLGPSAATPRVASPQGAAQTVPTGASDLSKGDVLVSGGTERFRQQVLTDRHRWVADEPESVGGEDCGPDPYEMFLAALGACTNMTLRMYADRKKIPLTAVSTQLRHRKVHAKDCDACESTGGMIDEIDREIELKGDFDDTTRARLMEIADRCPVHRTLTSETRIRTGEKLD